MSFPNNPMTKILLTFLAIGFLLSCAGKSPDKEFLRREVKLNENTYGYRVFVPKDRTPGQKLPVMLFLHGSDERGDDNEAQVRGFEKMIGENPEKFRFIVVFPQCRRNGLWAGEMQAQAIEALDDFRRRGLGDPNRLFLAGYSLGGFGVWQTALLYPKKFAALVPVSGRVLPRLDGNSKERGALSAEQLAADEAPAPYKAIAARIGRTPVWVFHGKNDPIVPIGQSRKIVEELRASGSPNVNATEYDDGGHLIFDKVFSEPRLFEWLEKQRLN